MPETSGHNRNQIHYFSRSDLPRMDPATRSATPYTLRQMRAVVAAAGITPEDRVLDVGCGPGKYTIALAAQGYNVEGMDLTPALVSQLHGVAPNIPAHAADLLDPPAELMGRFDVVTGFFMLHHLPDLLAAFAGVRALLAPGGRAVFCEPNPLFPGYYAQIAFTPGMTFSGERGILNLRPRQVERAARATGMHEFATTRFGAFPPALANSPVGARLERAFESVPGWRFARAFQLFSMHR